MLLIVGSILVIDSSMIGPSLPFPGERLALRPPFELMIGGTLRASASPNPPNVVSAAIKPVPALLDRAKYRRPDDVAAPPPSFDA